MYSRLLTPEVLANADDALPTFVTMVYHPVVGAFSMCAAGGHHVDLRRESW